MKLKEVLKKYRKAPYLWGGGLFAIAVLDCLDFLEYIIRAAISLVNNLCKVITLRLLWRIFGLLLRIP